MHEGAVWAYGVESHLKLGNLLFILKYLFNWLAVPEHQQALGCLLMRLRNGFDSNCW